MQKMEYDAENGPELPRSSTWIQAMSQTECESTCESTGSNSSKQWTHMDFMTAVPTVPIRQASASAMTSETSRKRSKMMLAEYGNPSTKLMLYESQSEQIQSIIERFWLSSEMNVAVMSALTNVPQAIPIILGYNEEQLLGWLKGVTAKETFDSWHAEWTTRRGH